MAEYVVFRKHGDPSGVPVTEVFYHYHLDDAITFADYKNASTEQEWAVAEVIPLHSWIVKLVRWAMSKSKAGE